MPSQPHPLLPHQPFQTFSILCMLATAAACSGSLLLLWPLCAALPLHTWEFGLYSCWWQSSVCCEPPPGSCTGHCSTSWRVWFAWVSSLNPLLLPSALKQVSWWSLLFSFCWFTLCLTNFWPYQCVLLTLTLHFRGQALFLFYKPQVQVELWKLPWPKYNVNTWKLHFRFPPILGCIVNLNEQSWQCLSTFLFWLQSKASCALYTVFSLINTWKKLAITFYFSFL